MNEQATHANELLEAIRAIAQANEQLAELARQQRSAIASMQAQEVQNIVARQRLVGHALADAEDKRRHAADTLARSMVLPTQTNINDLARALSAHDAATGRSLLDEADRARSAILECQREQRVVHHAASSIVAHLDGLARQVMAHLNKAGLYAASGSIAATSVPRGIDLVS